MSPVRAADESAHPSLLSVVNWFPVPSETFIVRKLTGLQAEGFDVTVGAARFFQPEAAAHGLRLLPLTPVRYPGSSWTALGAGGSVRAVGRAVGAELRAGRGRALRDRALLAPFRAAPADIVHFELSGIAVAYRHLFSALRPARVALSCRGTNDQVRPHTSPAWAEELADAFARVDLIHCVSDAMRRNVEGLGAPPEKVLVNRPAIPVERFAPLAAARRNDGPDRPEGPLRLLSVGRLTWVKGYDDVLRALAPVIASGRAVEYRVVGDGDEREKLSFLIDQLGLGEHVRLLGACDEAEVADLLGWADAFVLSSLSEGISNAVLEAMASGLPVVSTTCGGMAEVIDDGTDGLLVPVGDRRALRSAIERLADDASLRRRLGAAAAERASSSFGLERQVRAFAAAYDALAAGRPV
jgi:glycosyltransferase involved in cell wall biosynthesis